MSTDRELLELAAKARGLPQADRISADGSHLFYEVGDRDCETWTTWNPLTDDGDALRLAVKLRMDIDFNSNEVDVWHWVAKLEDDKAFISASFLDDPNAATRRCIVMAAAEIGRAMP
jgi:hypothetical protein